MDRLRNIEIFVEVARAESFTAAARRLGISRATATKHVAALEEGLNARLLNRSTHHVSLTDAGRMVLEGGVRILGQMEQLNEDVGQVSTDLRGVVRIGSPASFGASHLVPALAALRETHPGLEVVLVADDGESDLLREGLDLSIRIATALPDMAHVARLLAEVPQYLVASPAYLAAWGQPSAIADLAHHACLVHVLKAPQGIWTFETADGPVPVRVSGPVRADFGEALRNAALLGTGIAMHPLYMVRDDIAAGRLCVVLPEVRPERLAIHALFPLHEYLPRRIRVVVSFLRDWLRARIPAEAAASPATAAFQKSKQRCSNSRSTNRGA